MTAADESKLFIRIRAPTRDCPQIAITEIVYCSMKNAVKKQQKFFECIFRRFFSSSFSLRNEFHFKSTELKWIEPNQSEETKTAENRKKKL